MQIYHIPVDKHRRETTPHGTLEFPMAVYHSIMSQNVLGYINWHWHPELQFCLVTAGQICFSVNQRRYVLGPGQGIFINANFLHMAKAADSPDGSYICVDFSPRLLRFFDGSLLEEKYVRPWVGSAACPAIPLDGSSPWHNDISRYLLRLYEQTEQRAFGWEYESAALLAQSWLALIRNTPVPNHATPGQQQNNARLQRIMHYIHANVSDELSLANISAHVALSPSECCRFFKRMTGETMFAYIQILRLTKAVEQLRDSDCSISEVAYNCGFCSVSHFIETFRKHMGTTPLRYRKHVLSTRGAP